MLRQATFVRDAILAKNPFRINFHTLTGSVKSSKPLPLHTRIARRQRYIPCPLPFQTQGRAVVDCWVSVRIDHLNLTAHKLFAWGIISEQTGTASIIRLQKGEGRRQLFSPSRILSLVGFAFY